MKIMMATYEDGPPLWLVCLAPDTGIYAYTQQTNKFHYSHPLDMDHRRDMELTYTEITPEAAVDLIKSGIGIPQALPDAARSRLLAVELQLSTQDVLGEATHSSGRGVD